MFMSICSNAERSNVLKELAGKTEFICSTVMDLPGEDVESPDRLIAVVALKETEVRELVKAHVLEAVDYRNWMNSQFTHRLPKRA